MKKILFSFSLLLMATAGSLHAQNYKMGPDYKLAAGIRLSSAAPTLSNSISLKYFMNSTTALEGLVSFGSRFGVGGLYEMHQTLNSPGLQWYFGGGGFIGAESHSTYLGPTGVVGLDYKFSNLPLNLSLDWKPEINILPKIDFVPDALGFTARFTIQ